MQSVVVVLVVLTALAGCAPPPIYAPDPHPVVLMEESGLAASVRVPVPAALSGSAVVKGPWGLYGYGGGEWQAVEDSAVGRDHQAWFAGVGVSQVVPLTGPVRLWIEVSGGVGGGTSATQGREFFGGQIAGYFINESGSYTSQFGTVSLVAEHVVRRGLRSQVGVTGRVAHLDYDLTVSDPESVGSPAAWMVEPGLFLGLGNEWAQLRWRRVWAESLGGAGFGVRDEVFLIEVSVRLPFSAWVGELW